MSRMRKKLHFTLGSPPKAIRGDSNESRGQYYDFVDKTSFFRPKSPLTNRRRLSPDIEAQLRQACIAFFRELGRSEDRHNRHHAMTPAFDEVHGKASLRHSTTLDPKSLGRLAEAVAARMGPSMNEASTDATTQRFYSGLKVAIAESVTTHSTGNRSAENRRHSSAVLEPSMLRNSDLISDSDEGLSSFQKRQSTHPVESNNRQSSNLSTNHSDHIDRNPVSGSLLMEKRVLPSPAMRAIEDWMSQDFEKPSPSLRSDIESGAIFDQPPALDLSGAAIDQASDMGSLPINKTVFEKRRSAPATVEIVAASSRTPSFSRPKSPGLSSVSRQSNGGNSLIFSDGMPTSPRWVAQSPATLEVPHSPPEPTTTFGLVLSKDKTTRPAVVIDVTGDECVMSPWEEKQRHLDLQRAVMEKMMTGSIGTRSSAPVSPSTPAFNNRNQSSPRNSNPFLNNPKLAAPANGLPSGQWHAEPGLGVFDGPTDDSIPEEDGPQPRGDSKKPGLIRKLSRLGLGRSKVGRASAVVEAS